VTYGHWLDQATTALHTAQEAAATTRAAGHGDAAATITARNLIYQRLANLADQLGGGGASRTEATIRAAEHLVNSNARVSATSPGRLMGVGLRAAVLDPAPSAPAGANTAELVHHLTNAADALGLAADILASHLGPLNRPVRTPEGYALAAGAGQPGAWAELAKLASCMIEVDRRLPAWLSRGRSPRTLRAVYQPAVDRVRWWTRSRYPTILTEIAGQASGESVLRLLDAAPSSELSSAARQVSSLDGVTDVLDTARAWLHQYPGRAQYAHLVAATRLAVLISNSAARIDPDGPLDTRSYAYRWAQVAKKFERLTGLDQASPDALLQELDAASDWMRLRARAQMADPAYQGLQSDLDWRTAQPRLLGKLPGLAAQLDRAVAAGTTRGHLCVTQSELDMSRTRRGIFRTKVRWRKAKPSDDEVRALRARLANAARAPIDREQALGRALGDPVALARSSYPSSPERLSAVRTSPPEPASAHGAAAPHRAPRRRR
jgi:hypothetical protein